MDSLKESERIIDYLKAIRGYPKRYLGSDDEPRIANALLHGIRFSILFLLDFDGSFVSIADEVARRRGYWYHSDGVIAALQRKGLDDKQIVTELIESEIEFWRVFREQIDKECAE